MFSPPLYSVDAKIEQIVTYDFLWISFRITIGFVNLQIVTIYFLWISFRIRIGFVNSFPLNIFYLPTIDLALLYRLSPPLYSADAQEQQTFAYNFLWIYFRITIGFVNLQIVTIFFFWIFFRIRIRFVNSFPFNIFYPSGLSALAWFS